MQQLPLLLWIVTLFLCSISSCCTFPTSYYGNAEIYIIPSTEYDPCPPNKTCFTLQQFSNDITQNIKSKTTLRFLPGNHTLASKLTIDTGYVESLSLFSTTMESQIICEGLGSLMVSFVNNVQIQSLEFLNCEGNKVESVDNLTMQNCKFLVQEMGENESNISKTMLELSTTSATITNTSFNRFSSELVFLTSNHSVITVDMCHFSSKKGKALFVNSQNNRTIINTTFHNSDINPKFHGRNHTLIRLSQSNVTIKNSVITNNKGESIIYALKCNISFENTSILNNYGTFGVVYVVKSDVSLEGVLYSGNQGSLLVKNCQMTLRGSNMFERCTQGYMDETAYYGTFSGTQSQINLYGNTTFRENYSERSGAGMHISESLFSIYGILAVINNTSNYSGGGVFLHQADMLCHGRCIFTHNTALYKGGGIHANGAVILVKYGDKWTPSQYDYITLTVTDNEAMFGGGVYFEVGSKLYNIEDIDYSYSIEFSRNSAMHGGAIFVNDKTYSEVCESGSMFHHALTGCFFQTLYSNEHKREAKSTYYNVSFINNTADKGSILYGGLLDRCTLDDSVYNQGAQTNGGINSALANFKSKFGTATADEIASDAVRICFCNGTTPDCSHDYKPQPFMVKKGQYFNVTIVAVDQVNNPINATIHGTLSGNGVLGEGKVIQNTTEGCTKLIYNISSSYDSVDLGFHARKGPCKDLGLSKAVVKVIFTKCTCPIGFQQSKEDNTKCHCDCHKDLEPYVQVCDYLNDSFVKSGNSWLGFINESGNLIYIIHPNCPYDFCFLHDRVVIKLNKPNGVDAQCDYNRSGLLCGQCAKGLSLSAGTPQCVKCPKYWPILLVLSILAGLFGGILLVVILLLLNLTVALGTLNGLIFYANVVLSNRSTFLQFSEPNFITVFIHLFNTRLGLYYCLYEGMDEYGKTWLSIGFPLYLLSLVFIVIVMSTYSSRCTHLLGRSNPVATLASLLLLTYEGLLQTIIDIFSFTDLRYLNNSDVTVVRVWRPDASINYLQHKHIPLFLTGIVIVAVGLMYTTLLFSWQWILSFPDKRIFLWIRNTKLNSFIEAYHAPYKPKYRYWTGLLLFIRALQNIAIAANVSGNPRNSLLVVCVLILCLIMFKSYFGHTIYRSKTLDYLETASYFNLLFFTLASFYSLGDRHSQMKSAYISVSVAFVMFMGVILYHIHITLSKVQRYKALSHSISQRVKRTYPNATYDHYSIMTPSTEDPITPTSSEVSMSTSLVCSANNESKSQKSESDRQVERKRSMTKKQIFNYYSSKHKRPFLLDLH